MKSGVTKKILLLISFLVGSMITGTLLYYFGEGLSLFESFYMTVITMTTVGFEEVRPLSKLGRVITIFVIASGVTIVTYSVGTLLKLFAEGELKQFFGRTRVERQILKLKQHYIVCGYGRIGKLIANELKESSLDLVVIEHEESKIDEIVSDGHLSLTGDARTEEVLERAGVHNAKGLVTAVNSDADNVFIVLTAKSLNDSLFIMSRAAELSSEKKLLKAGASKVMFPYLIGGRRMAQALTRPTVVDFIDIAMVDTELGLEMGEAHISENSAISGKNLFESNLRKDFGIIIVAIKKSDGTMVFNPTYDAVLESDDVLVVLGAKKNLEELRQVL